jgi:predicted transposase YdaD
MCNKELTKYQALELITPIVDDEVSDQQREAFFRYIATHQDVRKKYESVKNIKSLICSRCPSTRAPETLREHVRQLIRKNK